MDTQIEERNITTNKEQMLFLAIPKENLLLHLLSRTILLPK
jgi:hypothetical protein